MNRWEKELARLELKGEREVLGEMRGHYEAALGRVNAKIEALAERDDLPGIRQRRFQEMLAEQIGGALDELRGGAHATLEGYLRDSYEQGFVGALYSLQKQGIPLAFPIDQASMARAVSITAGDVKLSRRVYSNVDKLQRQVVAEITRGFADAESATAVAGRIAAETDIAAGIKRNVRGRTNQAFRRSMTIARTEKGRVTAGGRLDAMRKAKEAGADVVKQWDSTLDSRTRPDHVAADGQIREIDEPFFVGGCKGLAPHMLGRPEQDVNCRCAVLQRSRAEFEVPEEAAYTKWDGTSQCFVDLSDAESYDEFKRRYDSLRAGLSSGVMGRWLDAYEPEEMIVVTRTGERRRFSGDQTGVPIGPEIAALLRDADVRHTHTTPVGGTFSIEDIEATVDYWMKSHEVEATLSGEKFALVRTARATPDSAEEFKTAFAEYEGHALEALEVSYWEEHCEKLGLPLSDQDRREVDRLLKEALDAWLGRNAERFGYSYSRRASPGVQ